VSDRRLVAVKALHTVAFAAVELCVAVVLADGLRGRTSRRTAVAAAVVLGEIAVFLGNGARCPLTAVAARYGAKPPLGTDLDPTHGTGATRVADIYLPRWAADLVFPIHLPLVAAIARLHVGRVLHPRGGRVRART
jgi:hypothetical protein